MNLSRVTPAYAPSVARGTVEAYASRGTEIYAVPDQHGRRIIVTDSGREATKRLAAAGARVTMARRSAEKAQAAADGIRAEVPGADLETMELDLADLESVHEKGYASAAAYPQPKLADLLLGPHLARVAADRSWALRSTMAHPGYTNTNLQTAGASYARSVWPVAEDLTGTGLPRG